jgi:alkylhydroperoxidase family enzyme
MPRLSEIPSYHEKAQNRYVKLMYQMKFGDQEFETAPGNATGVTGNAETVFAHVPDVMEHMLRGFEYYFSSDRILDPLLRELSVVRAAWATGSQFVFSQHSRYFAPLAERSSRSVNSRAGRYPTFTRIRSALFSLIPTDCRLEGAGSPMASSTH